MAINDIKLLSEDQEQVITLKWDHRWNTFKKQLKNNSRAQQYRRARHLLNQYRGDRSPLMLRSATNMSFFFDFKNPVDLDKQYGEVYWGEAATALYRESLREQEALRQISSTNNQSATENLAINPLTVITVFATPEKFNADAIALVVQKQASSAEWSSKAKKWLQSMANNSSEKKSKLSAFDFFKKILSRTKSAR